MGNCGDREVVFELLSEACFWKRLSAAWNFNQASIFCDSTPWKNKRFDQLFVQAINSDTGWIAKWLIVAYQSHYFLSFSTAHGILLDHSVT
jgi:hypothetical protein